VNETLELALSTQLLETVPVRLKSASNERHFTIEVETVFRPYLLLHCSAVSDIYHTERCAHALRAVQVMLKSVGNEGHFTLETETLFRPISHLMRYEPWKLG
jgi:hypothetical protein